MVSNRELLIKELESKYLRKEPETFNVGDTVKVNFKIKEGKRERVQVFEGIVIAMNGSGLRKTVTVRKLSFNNVNVERVFPLHSPKIDKIVVARQGRVRRAKLYYLRNLRGKAAQVKRFIDNKSKSATATATATAVASSKSDSSDSKSKTVSTTKKDKIKPDTKGTSKQNSEISASDVKVDSNIDSKSDK